MNHDKFFYKKEQYIRQHGIGYAWILIDKQSRNGVHFHGEKYDAETIKEISFLSRDNRFGFSTHGIERHAATGSGEPSHTDCQVTGGKCWHDGTSLYASGRLGHVNPDDCDDEVWSVLHSFYRSHFERDQYDNQ